jgi:hypothetical protein
MANDITFGTLDFQHDEINLDLDDELSLQLPSTFSQNPPHKLPLDVEKQLSNTILDDKQPNDNSPNDTFSNAKIDDSKQSKIESDVEDGPHTETEPQLLQQRDNVPAVDPVPDSRYNLRNKNRQNPYTFSGKVAEKWTEAPHRNRRRTRSLDQKL